MERIVSSKRTGTRVLFVSLVCGSALLVATPPRRADACGGCFVPTDTVTNVESHRMVISLTPEETILWDQIQYSGNPEDFVWVLPVPSPDTQIEIADPVFFDEIDSQTTPRVQPALPLLPCQNGVACGASGDSGATTGSVDAMTMPEDEVTVFAEETIGPYETVIIGSEDATALRTWLNDHGYSVPQETDAVIDHYIETESVFVVLRLAPGQGVQAMQPVRVRYEGYMGRFPLKMVTVGSRGLVGMSLWVIAEQRYEARNYPTTRIDDSRLVWDWSTNSSNYTQAFNDSIQAAGGRAWIVEHASPLNRLIFSSNEVNEIFSSQPFPYLTRMRTNMLVDYLDEDLILAPSADSSEVANLVTAYDERNRPQGDCEEAAIRRHGCAAAASGVTIVSNYGPTFLVFLCFFLYRRRRRVSVQRGRI